MFYWIEEGKLAGSSYPLLEELKKLYSEGFRILISLEKRSDVNEIKRIGFRVFTIYVEDYMAPTIEQLEEFNSIVSESKKPILVHCYAGLGRTGTMLAGYLIEKGMGAKEAISFVRSKAEHAIEIRSQEKVLEEYEIYRKFL